MHNHELATKTNVRPKTVERERRPTKVTPRAERGRCHLFPTWMSHEDSRKQTNMATCLAGNTARAISSTRQHTCTVKGMRMKGSLQGWHFGCGLCGGTGFPGEAGKFWGKLKCKLLRSSWPSGVKSREREYNFAEQNASSNLKKKMNEKIIFESSEQMNVSSTCWRWEILNNGSQKSKVTPLCRG